MNDIPELESRVQGWLDEIKPVPRRDPDAAARARARFLSQAVSASELQRHKGWKLFNRKERFAMNVLMSILVVAGLLFGGGLTVNAAHDDLPGDPLYFVKILSEDASLQFQRTPEQKVDRLMTLAQTRIEEMTRLTETDQPIPDPLRSRLEQHLQQALQLCSGMDDAALDRSLLQLRDRLQQQDRDLEQLQIHAALQSQPVLAQTRTMLQTRLQLVEEGLLDRAMFRNAARTGFRWQQQVGTTPTPQSANGMQSGQPTAVPGGPNPATGGQNPNPGEPNTDPGGPNLEPGGPNLEPGGPNMSPTGPGNTSGGSQSGGDSPAGQNGPGGPAPKDSGSGGSGSGGAGPGGNKP